MPNNMTFAEAHDFDAPALCAAEHAEFTLDPTTGIALTRMATERAAMPAHSATTSPIVIQASFSASARRAWRIKPRRVG